MKSKKKEKGRASKGRKDKERSKKVASTNQIFNLDHAGTDTSIGTGKEIYGASIEVEEEGLKILCLHGVSQHVR
jgi:hypothetical protein